MKILIKFIFVLILMDNTLCLQAQVTFRNQLEFTRWEEYDRNILENWTDLTYQYKLIQAGLRYEINHPPDPFIFPVDTLLDEYELTFRYAEIAYKNLNVRLGNFYTMFGRGLTLRSYEDRNLRVDNNLDGIQMKFSLQNLKLQAIAGKMRDKYNRRDNTLYGLDGEVFVIDGVQIGGSYLQQNKPGARLKQVGALRLFVSREWWDIYSEFAFPELKHSPGVYVAVNMFLDRFALTAEYKNYRDLSFANTYGTEYNAAPSLTREHSFSLLNRHPHFLNMNDEQGYQLEGTYALSDEIEILLNHSKTFNHENLRLFEEYYSELHHYFSGNLEYRLAADWNFDYTSRTENITPIADVTYNMTSRDQLHLSYQHQHTKNTLDKSEFDNELAIIEYSRSPLFTVAMVGEYTNKNQIRNIDLDRHTWLYGTITINFWHNQQFSLMYGSRQEGFICVGGICRYEPEFQGIELKLITRF